MRKVVAVWGAMVLSGIAFSGYGQKISLSETPPRVYFTSGSGSAATQQIRVDNLGKEPLKVGVSLGDWNYDSVGNNMTYEAGTLKNSCANWLQVLPGSFFTIPPGKWQILTLRINVPARADTSVPVHTAMVYLTQLNGEEGKDKGKAALEIHVQLGVKVYHRFSGADRPGVEIMNFQDPVLAGDSSKDIPPRHVLRLQLQNTGRCWVEGSIKPELLNEQNGKSVKLNNINFYSLPGDNRYITIELPPELEKGKYSATAIINYGNKDDLKIAELEFTE